MGRTLNAITTRRVKLKRKGELMPDQRTTAERLKAGRSVWTLADVTERDSKSVSPLVSCFCVNPKTESAFEVGCARGGELFA